MQAMAVTRLSNALLITASLKKVLKSTLPSYLAMEQFNHLAMLPAK
jgi:hypothetical protein